MVRGSEEVVRVDFGQIWVMSVFGPVMSGASRRVQQHKSGRLNQPGRCVSASSRHGHPVRAGKGHGMGGRGHTRDAKRASRPAPHMAPRTCAARRYQQLPAARARCGRGVGKRRAAIALASGAHAAAAQSKAPRPPPWSDRQTQRERTKGIWIGGSHERCKASPLALQLATGPLVGLWRAVIPLW